MAAAGKNAPDETWWRIALKHPTFRERSRKMTDDYAAWCARLHAAMDDGPGYVEGRIDALPHGSYLKRRYYERQSILDGFDPCKELTTDAGGALRWTEMGSSRAKLVSDYLAARH
jgi:hypothetical protein